MKDGWITEHDGVIEKLKKAVGYVTGRKNDDINTINVGGNTFTAKLEDPVNSARLELIKKIVEVYDKQEKRDNGKIRWAKPLCDLELCTTSLSDNQTVYHDLLQEQEIAANQQMKRH